MLLPNDAIRIFQARYKENCCSNSWMQECQPQWPKGSKLQRSKVTKILWCQIRFPSVRLQIERVQVRVKAHRPVGLLTFDPQTTPVKTSELYNPCSKTAEFLYLETFWNCCKSVDMDLSCHSLPSSWIEFHYVQESQRESEELPGANGSYPRIGLWYENMKDILHDHLTWVCKDGLMFARLGFVLWLAPSKL